MILLDCLLALLSGAAYEACSVGFVYFTTRRVPWQTAMISALQATAQVVGIGEAVHDWRTAPFFVLGYATGSFIAILVTKRRDENKG